jgi:DnaJ domain
MPAEIPTFKDYYEVLHLHPEADAAMVDQAYWHLARLYNAAIPTDSGARPMLEELNEAYSVLRTPELRDEYDNLRDAVLGVGALPEPRAAAVEPLPLSVMEKQKAKPKSADETQPPDPAEPTPAHPAPRTARTLPRPHLNLSVRSIVVPNWQSIVVLAAFLVLAGAGIAAGAEPALILLALIVGVGFTVIPVMVRAPRLPSLPRPQVVLPAIGPPNLGDRLPRHNVDTSTLRDSTEAMLARWRESTPQQPPESDPAPDASAESLGGEASYELAEEPLAEEPPPPAPADADRLRDSLRKSTEAIRARMRDAQRNIED